MPRGDHVWTVLPTPILKQETVPVHSVRRGLNRIRMAVQVVSCVRQGSSLQVTRCVRLVLKGPWLHQEEPALVKCVLVDMNPMEVGPIVRFVRLVPSPRTDVVPHVPPMNTPRKAHVHVLSVVQVIKRLRTHVKNVLQACTRLTLVLVARVLKVLLLRGREVHLVRLVVVVMKVCPTEQIVKRVRRENMRWKEACVNPVRGIRYPMKELVSVVRVVQDLKKRVMCVHLVGRIHTPLMKVLVALVLWDWLLQP